MLGDVVDIDIIAGGPPALLGGGGGILLLSLHALRLGIVTVPVSSAYSRGDGATCYYKCVSGGGRYNGSSVVSYDYARE